MRLRDKTRDPGSPRKRRAAADPAKPGPRGHASTGAYATAYELQYGRKDLASAIEAYARVIDSDPGSREAGYSRAQLQGIVRQVVPEEELRRAQTGLALAHLRATGYVPENSDQS